MANGCNIEEDQAGGMEEIHTNVKQAGTGKRSSLIRPACLLYIFAPAVVSTGRFPQGSSLNRIRQLSHMPPAMPRIPPAATLPTKS